MNIINFRESIKKSESLFRQLEIEKDILITNNTDLELIFYSILNKLKKGERFSFESLSEINTSYHYQLIQLLIEYGLYEQVIQLTSEISLDSRCIKLIFDVFKDRLAFSLKYITSAFQDIDMDSSLGNMAETFRTEIANTPLKENQENFGQLFQELKELDFNRNLSRFAYLFNLIFPIESYRNDVFFKTRKPAPFVLKNYPHYIFKICEIDGDFSLYDRICYEKNSFLSDLIFVETVNKASHSFYESASVATLHKLVRICGIDFTIEKFRK